jgi:drug/metabolite transporter (DMT)-like permease
MPGSLQDLFNYKGEICSLLCAMLWATSVLFFRKAGEKIPAFPLNFYKNTVVLLLLLPTAAILGHTNWPTLSPGILPQILLSGVIGICFADFLFFKALNILGAGRNAILGCSYSLFMFLFSSLLLGEKTAPVHMAGAALVIAGIVLSEIKFHKKQPSEPTAAHDRVRGTFYGLLAMALTALGVLIVRPIMKQNLLPVDQVAILRLAAGITGALAVITATGRLKTTIHALSDNFPWKPFLAASILGGYLAMTIWLLGYKYTSAANVAAILNQTSTLFTVVLAAIFLKEPLTSSKAAGAIVAFSGVAVILFLS